MEPNSTLETIFGKQANPLHLKSLRRYSCDSEMHSNDLGENNHTPANKPQKNLIIKKRLITPLITSGFESGITESSNIKHDDGVF